MCMGPVIGSPTGIAHCINCGCFSSLLHSMTNYKMQPIYFLNIHISIKIANYIFFRGYFTITLQIAWQQTNLLHFTLWKPSKSLYWNLCNTWQSLSHSLLILCKCLLKTSIWKTSIWKSDFIFKSKIFTTISNCSQLITMSIVASDSMSAEQKKNENDEKKQYHKTNSLNARAINCFLFRFIMV